MKSNVLSRPASEQGESARSRVRIPATGGTIAGQAGSKVDSGYTSGQVGVENLINAVPGIRSLAELSGEQIAQWLRLAARKT